MSTPTEKTQVINTLLAPLKTPYHLKRDRFGIFFLAFPQDATGNIQNPIDAAAATLLNAGFTIAKEARNTIMIYSILPRTVPDFDPLSIMKA